MGWPCRPPKPPDIGNPKPQPVVWQFIYSTYHFIIKKNKGDIMELYNPEEYSRPTAIWAQFEVMRKKIEELENKIEELTSLLP